MGWKNHNLFSGITAPNFSLIAGVITFRSESNGNDHISAQIDGRGVQMKIHWLWVVAGCIGISLVMVICSVFQINLSPFFNFHGIAVVLLSCIVATLYSIAQSLSEMKDSILSQSKK